MASTVHALNVGVVVLSLGTIGRTLGRVGTDRRAKQQAGTRADTSAPVPTANGRTGSRANESADHRTTYG